MTQDLAKYDFIDLCMAKQWPEEEQATLVLNFSELLSKYLEQQLASDFTPEINQKYEEIIKDPSVTPEKLLSFYTTNLPNLEQRIDGIFLDLKKRFLLKYYSQEAQHDPQWSDILMAAEHDEWDTVWEKLTGLTVSSSPPIDRPN
jgi:hypothetical protein